MSRTWLAVGLIVASGSVLAFAQTWGPEYSTFDSAPVANQFQGQDQHRYPTAGQTRFVSSPEPRYGESQTQYGGGQIQYGSQLPSRDAQPQYGAPPTQQGYSTPAQYGDSQPRYGTTPTQHGYSTPTQYGDSQPRYGTPPTQQGYSAPTQYGGAQPQPQYGYSAQTAPPTVYAQAPPMQGFVAPQTTRYQPPTPRPARPFAHAPYRRESGAPSSAFGVSNFQAPAAPPAPELAPTVGPGLPEVAAPPVIQPPSVQPPSVQPPSVQPPSVQPPSVQPPSIQSPDPAPAGIETPPVSVISPPTPPSTPSAPAFPAVSGWDAHSPVKSVIDGAAGGDENFDDILAIATSARNGFFLQYDHLLWSITAPHTRVIGNPDAEDFYIVDSVLQFRRNSLDTSFIDDELDSAHRFEFGYNDGCTGWICGVIFGDNSHSLQANGVSFIPEDTSTVINERLLSGFVDANTDGIDDDLDGDNFHGNDGEDQGTPDGMGGFMLPFDGIPDQPAPLDTGDMVIYLPVFTDFSSRNSVAMRGIELMNTRRYQTSARSHLEWLYGIRYLEIKDSFSIDGSGGILDHTSISTMVRNNIMGPQVGARWATCSGHMRLSLEGRLLAGYNFQRGRQNGEIATNFSPGPNLPAALTPFSFNSAISNEEFSPMGEWRVDMAYYINSWTAFRLGYSGAAVGGVSYAGPKVLYTLPNFGTSNAKSSETVIVSALTMGVEFNR